MSNRVFRFLEVDVTTDNTIKISPSNYEAKNNSPLVDTLDVIAHPRDGVSNTRVDAQGPKESSCIFNLDMESQQTTKH